MMARLILSLIVLLAPKGILAATAELTVLGPDGPIEGAIVYLPLSGTASPGTHVIAQEKRQFVPRVSVITPGTAVDFPNRDETQHHVYSFSPAKTFELQLYSGVPQAPVVFDKAGIVEVGCNIHDRMQAFVLVLDTTVHTVTGPDGVARLPLPESVASPATLQVWHERLVDNTRPVMAALAPGGTASVTLELVPPEPVNQPLNRLQQRFRDL